MSIHFKLNGRALCANRAHFTTTTDTRAITCIACKKKLAKIYERILTDVSDTRTPSTELRSLPQ